jgi:MutS domain V
LARPCTELAESSKSEQAPRAELERRLALRQELARRRGRIDYALSWIRGGLAAAGLVLWWLSLGPDGIATGWILVPVAAFLVAVVVHDGVARRRRLAGRAVAFYEAGIARLENRWAGTGDDGARFLDEAHPYAADLDLFGRGSLYELLGTARTGAGRRTLADWLRSPAPPAEARSRQAAVAELRPALALREDLALSGDEVGSGIDPVALTAWSTAPPAPLPRLARPISRVLAALDVVAAAAWALGAGPRPFIAAVAVAGAWAWTVRTRVERTLRAAERPGQDLELLAAVLARLERERFVAPLLVGLRQRLETDGLSASAQVRRLAGLQQWLDSRRNQFFAPVALPLLWSTQLALAIEAWRVRVGPRVPVWLAAVGEMEALSALAGYAFEHPEDPFPQIVDEGPLFDASGIGHPLIPETACVRNDVRLDADLRLLLVSGSNMSGKSTLLRTVGLNAVLGLAGAPVRASSLRLSRFSIGASIRIVDSLQTGTSRFYAEITRLRELMDLARDYRPLLFLIDEILHGTNSEDRRVGGEAIVRGLLERGALGLTTTHDLALARIADDPALRAQNVHFDDHLEGGRVAFDYRLKTGVVTRSNAIALMRAVGLEV